MILHEPQLGKYLASIGGRSEEGGGYATSKEEQELGRKLDMRVRRNTVARAGWVLLRFEGGDATWSEEYEDE